MYKNPINKIIKSIKNGTFMAKLSEYMSYRHRYLNVIFYEKNKNLKEYHYQQKDYDRLYKKYKKIIEKGVKRDSPVKKSNKIWICWFQGIDSAPELVQACINSVKKNMSNYEVIILTENNLFDFIKFPDYIISKWKKGIIPPAHFSDLIRTELMCEYGGLWLDATVLCTGLPDSTYPVFNVPFFVYKQLDLSRHDLTPIVASSWLIYSESGQHIMLLTRKLLHQYWKENNYLKNYFLFHLFFSMSARRYPKEWNAIPVFNNHSPHTMQFELNNQFEEKRWNQLKNISYFHKLNHHINFKSDSRTIYKYIIEEYKD